MLRNLGPYKAQNNKTTAANMDIDKILLLVQCKGRSELLSCFPTE